MKKHIAKISMPILCAAAILAAPALSRAQDATNTPAPAGRTIPPVKKPGAAPSATLSFHGILTAVDTNAMTLTIEKRTFEMTSETIVTKDDNTYLIVPNGVNIAGEGLNDLGQEPKTQAHLFGYSGSTYKIQLTGNAAPTASAGDAQPEGTGPQIEQIMPRLYDKTIPILAVALGILALGFALLYRANGTVPAKESNERGRS